MNASPKSTLRAADGGGIQFEKPAMMQTTGQFGVRKRTVPRPAEENLKSKLESAQFDDQSHMFMIGNAKTVQTRS